MPLKSVKEYKWKEEDMKHAVETVRTHKMGYLEANRLYKVPHTTLFRYCKSNKHIENFKNKLCYPQI